MEEWLRPFIAALEKRLNVLRGRDVRLFFDYRVLEAGSMWPSEVAHALSGSRLLLAVITPRYFHSTWALAEWSTFEMRERALGMQDSGLIFPVIARLGRDTDLSILRQRQVLDLSSTFGPLFMQSADALRAIDRLAAAISRGLDAAPPPLVDLPVVEPRDVDPEPLWPKPRFLK